MKKPFILYFFVPVLISILFVSCTQKKHSKIIQQSFQRLIDGNKRYTENKSIHPNRSEERRKELNSKQSPFAIIVGCSDSRVSPEIIFDEGLGDLFVVRTAGNVIGQIELESIEYSALNLQSSIILVLGHENCGAVNAVLQNKTSNIGQIAQLIEPSIKKIENKTGNDLEQAIKNNALNMKHLLEKSPNIEPLIKDNKIEVQAAYYNFKTGLVEILQDTNNN